MPVYGKRIFANQTLGIDLGGTTGAIFCGSNASLDDMDLKRGQGFSMSAWIRPDDPGENNAGTVISKGGAGDGGLNVRMNGTVGAGVVRFFKDYDTTDLIVNTAAGTFTEGVFAHLAVTWDGNALTTGVHIFKDGTEASYDAGTLVNGTVAKDSDAANNFIIGNSATDVNTFDGIITEVAVWSTVISNYDILRLARSRFRGIPLTVSPANLCGYWPLDDYPPRTSLLGRLVEDLSGNKNKARGITATFRMVSSGNRNLSLAPALIKTRRRHYRNPTAAAPASDTGIMTPRSGYWGDL